MSKKGFGAFGPIDIHSEFDTFGYITSAPKSDWRDFNFIRYLKRTF